MKNKQEIRTIKDSKIYVVMNQYLSGIWGVADFWHGLPYASTSFKKAHEYKENLCDLAKNISEIWDEKKFKVVKFVPNK